MARAGCCRPGSSESAASAFIAAVLPNVVLPEDAQPWARIVFGPPPALEPEGEAIVREAGERYFAAAAQAAAQSGNDLPAIAAAVRAATGQEGRGRSTCRCVWRSRAAATVRSSRRCSRPCPPGRRRRGWALRLTLVHSSSRLRHMIRIHNSLTGEKQALQTHHAGRDSACMSAA